MQDTTARLALPLLAASQAQKHVTHNEALDLLDQLVHLWVADDDRTAPPPSPQEGDSHLIAASATGPWAGRSGQIALFTQGGWTYLVPQRGWRAWEATSRELLVYDGTTWGLLPGRTSASQFGVNATADTQNRLAVSSPASLFNHAGAGHQLKLNKAAAGDTASLLYQTAFSGRAEMGLAGDDNWQLKVSPDGSTWLTALTVNRATGVVATPQTPDRERLSAARTYFVRTDGNDANTGLANTAGAAFRTIQKGLNTILESLDLGGFDASVQVGAGTYPEALTVFSAQVGAGRIILSGDTVTPANVTISSAAAISIHVRGVGSRLFVRGVRVTNSAFAGWLADAGGVIQSLGPNEIGATGTFHIVAEGPSAIYMGTALTVSGNCAGAHLLAQNNGTINLSGGAWTFVGPPTFGSSFANAMSGGVIFAFGNSFTGTPTCARYFATLNGTIQTNGGGPTYFPGTTAGGVATGGQYG